MLRRLALVRAEGKWSATKEGKKMAAGTPGRPGEQIRAPDSPW